MIVAAGTPRDPTPELDRPAWQQHALCHGRTAVFFSADQLTSAIACALCKRCAVRRECAEFADELERDGISLAGGVWAGRTRR